MESFTSPLDVSLRVVADIKERLDALARDLEAATEQARREGHERGREAGRVDERSRLELEWQSRADTLRSAHERELAERALVFDRALAAKLDEERDRLASQTEALLAERDAFWKETLQGTMSEAEEALNARHLEAREAACDEAYARGRRDAEGTPRKPVGEERLALEEAYARGRAEAHAAHEKALKAAYEEGYQEGSQAMKRAAAAGEAKASGAFLDEARRQAYENGYDDGKSVGLARGKRQAEGESAAKIQEAARTGYREGFEDGKREAGGDDRAWAFGVMHLSPEASASDVRQRYKRLSMLMHPDQNPGLGDAYIKNLNRARDLLER